MINFIFIFLVILFLSFIFSTETLLPPSKIPPYLHFFLCICDPLNLIRIDESEKFAPVYFLA